MILIIFLGYVIALSFLVKPYLLFQSISKLIFFYIGTLRSDGIKIIIIFNIYAG